MSILDVDLTDISFGDQGKEADCQLFLFTSFTYIKNAGPCWPMQTHDMGVYDKFLSFFYSFSDSK